MQARTGSHLDNITVIRPYNVVMGTMKHNVCEFKIQLAQSVSEKPVIEYSVSHQAITGAMVELP